jgi:GNAT superfamily N-acetyltransferase
MRSLPDWFGIEDAIVRYVKDVATMETWIAEDANEPVGFLTLRSHNPSSSEIQVMAIRARVHRRGVGRALVEHAAAILRQRGVEYFHVKTLGPSRPNEAYENTRRFYHSVGFVPLEENRLWGDANPCLILVRHLGCERDGGRGET